MTKYYMLYLCHGRNTVTSYKRNTNGKNTEILDTQKDLKDVLLSEKSKLHANWSVEAEFWPSYSPLPGVTSTNNTKSTKGTLQMYECI